MRFCQRHALPFALVLALAGCSVGPKYERPAMELPATYADPSAKGEVLAVPADWWTLYLDPLLDDFIRAGLERNADVRQATARVEEAEAVLREAHATLVFPLVTGNAGVTRSATQDNGTRTTYALGDNFNAARLSGLPVRTTTLMIYVYAALTALLAGLVVASASGTVDFRTVTNGSLLDG